jgi:mRNA interferase MazF
MARFYVPDAGDLVWINFEPHAGHRPSVVLSPAAAGLIHSRPSCQRSV